MKLISTLMFLPGAWIAYGLSRWILSQFNVAQLDQVALSVLAGFAYFAGALIITVDLRGMMRADRG